MNFPDLGEFRFVSKLLEGAAPLKQDAPVHRGWLAAGDDCAIFDGWLATKDLSVENVHFRMDWSSPEQAVEKHIVSNVSAYIQTTDAILKLLWEHQLPAVASCDYEAELNRYIFSL